MAKSYLDHDSDYLYPDPDSDLHYALPTAFEAALQKLTYWAGYWKWNGRDECLFCGEQCQRVGVQIGSDVRYPDCGNQAMFFIRSYPGRAKVAEGKSYE